MFGAHGFHLPINSDEFYVWAFLLIVLYVVLALAVRHARGKRAFDAGTLVYNAVTFSGSFLLLIGVLIDKQVLKLMGDTTWFLIVAGAFGVIYSVQASFKQ